MEQMIPMYSTKTFEDIYDSVDTFLADYGNLGLPKTITDSNANILYYLLFSRYGNSPIANLDENQFKTKLQAIIWQYGPAWEKRLDIQDKIRKFTEEDILKGASTINNHASNPGEIASEHATGVQPELQYVDSQNTNRFIKSKVDAYGNLWELLKSDVTSDFLSKFQKLFKQFIRPEVTYIYESEI